MYEFRTLWSLTFQPVRQINSQTIVLRLSSRPVTALTHTVKVVLAVITHGGVEFSHFHPYISHRRLRCLALIQQPPVCTQCELSFTSYTDRVVVVVSLAQIHSQQSRDTSLPSQRLIRLYTEMETRTQTAPLTLKTGTQATGLRLWDNSSPWHCIADALTFGIF